MFGPGQSAQEKIRPIKENPSLDGTGHSLIAAAEKLSKCMVIGLIAIYVLLKLLLYMIILKMHFPEHCKNANNVFVIGLITLVKCKF